ncbi:MAG: hypothetical protein IPK16_25830 [Anaerolineales bacterium]|nr:hypothetical protein [Anaerolineales bacterium]
MGTTEPWSFTFQLDGANDQTVTNAAPAATWDNLTPNQVYTLSEVDPGAQWQMGAISCLVNDEPVSDGDLNAAGFQVNVTPGAVVACSITNTVTPGKITLTKNVVGTTEPWSFTFQLNGANDQTVTNVAPMATWDNLTPNQVYTLSEVYPGAGWQVGAISCLVNDSPVGDGDPNVDGFQVNVTPGASVVCDITNTVKPGQITLTKNVEGTTEPWSFTFQLNGGNDQIVNNGSPVATWDNLTPNQVYTLAEVNPGAGWQMGAISCLVNDVPVSDSNPTEAGFQVTVTPGSTVVCSITNTREPGKITLTKNVVGTTEPWAFGFTLNGGDLRTASNNSPVVSWENPRPECNIHARRGESWRGVVCWQLQLLG